MPARVIAALNGRGFWALVFVLMVGVTQIGSLEREVIRKNQKESEQAMTAQGCPLWVPWWCSSI